MSSSSLFLFFFFLDIRIRVEVTFVDQVGAGTRAEEKKGKKAEKEALNAFERRPEFTCFFLFIFFYICLLFI